MIDYVFVTFSHLKIDIFSISITLLKFVIILRDKIIINLKFLIMKHIFLFLLVLLLGVSVYSCKDEFVTDQPEGLILKNGSVLTDTELLGRYLFFDMNLSDPAGVQSCATCHGPEVGYTGPHEAINKAGAVYEGAFPGRFGDRKPPSAAYGGDSPILHFDGDHWIGGMFWDGRATGWTLGDPLAEQALGPFLNPMEQNISSPADVIQIIKDSEYATLFESVYPGSLNGDVTEAYNNVGRAIAAYERSAEVSSFTSKFDYFLAGKAKLTGQEEWGLQLFNGKGKCNLCHASIGVRPLFTDFKYDNLGVPKNPLNPYYLANPDFVDFGLGGYLQSAGFDESVWSAEWGKHKVPTLRNVDKRPYKKFTKAYTHNGVFKSLEEVVHFYNTRDVGNWPAPEVAENVNNVEMGNLGLNLGEELAIVAFMKTLSDGYVLKK